MMPAIHQSNQYTFVGTSTRRRDAPDKLTGRARFAGDLPFHKLLYARLVMSPYAHARIVSIDTSELEGVPGVVAIYTGETLGLMHADEFTRTQCPLARQEVCWCGQPVAIVLAETEAAAEDGVAAVNVDYEPLPAVLDPVAAIQPDSLVTRQYRIDEKSVRASNGAHAAISISSTGEKHENLSENVCGTASIQIGDIEAGWREASVVVEHTYRTHPVHQSYMEPQSVTVVPSPSGHQLTVWASVQSLFEVRTAIARAVGISERQISIESLPIGGAFGGKFGLYEPLVAAAAMQIQRPVRLVLTRQEDLLAGNPAPQAVITLKLGTKKDGTLVAIQGKVIFNAGAYPGAEADLGGFILASTYLCPNIDLHCYEVITNTVSVGAYRAPNAPQATFALESAVDELCLTAGFDPIAFRKHNAFKEGDKMVDGGIWPHIGLLECIERIESHPLWANRTASKKGPIELDGWKIGVGISIGGWLGTTETAAAACRLERDGTFTVIVGSVDLTGSDTSLAQIAAEVLEISPDAVVVCHDNTDTMPYAGGTGGSKTTYTLGPAVLAAAREVRNQVLLIASNMLEASIDDLEIQKNRVVVRGMLDRSIELKHIAAQSMSFNSGYAPVYSHGRSANVVSSPMFTAHLTRVAVDPETGDVRILDYVAAQDVGYAINPAEVEGQIYGGVTQGIGWALFESLEYDNNGQLLTSTLMDYALPHAHDVPNIVPILVEIPSTLGPYGAKGVGEPPVVAVCGAIANAIRDAVGARLSEIPMTPERVFNAIQAQEY